MTAEIQKPITATNFDDCMSEEYEHLKGKYPNMEEPQRKAIALNVCRKKFPETSKARILRILEKSALENNESLEPLIRAVKKSLNREEILEYCVLLRQEGFSTPQVAGMIKYKESWVKKYVNPIFNVVTEIELELPEEVTRSSQFLNTIMKAVPIHIDPKKREFDSWATVEVEDSEKEIVGAEGVKDTMPIYMERGGVLLYGHSNRHVGKVLKWKYDHKEVDGRSAPGILIRGKVFNHYKIDDQAWASVELAAKLGKPILSIGATPTSDRYDCSGDKCNRFVEKEQLYEITIVEMIEGSQGANPEATLDRMIEKDQNIASLLKDLYLNTVSSGVVEYNNLLKGGLDEVKASELLLMDVLNKMTPDEEKKNKEASQNPPDEQKDTAEVEKNELVTILKEMHSMIKSLVEKQAPPPAEEPEEEVPPPPAEEPEEEKDEPETPAKSAEEALTLSKMDDVTFLQLAKQKGFQIVETSTPSVTDTRAELKKRTAPPKKAKFPTSEEMSEAMRNWKDGEISKLSAKYGFET